MICNRKKAVLKQEQYPSAALLQDACYKDYKDVLERYSKVYDRISIVLGVCSVVLVTELSFLDYHVFLKIKERWIEDGGVSVLLSMAPSISAVLLIIALLMLLGLVRGNSIRVFDSIPIRNKGIYNLPQDQAAVWLINCYTNAIVDLKVKVAQKQKRFNCAVTLIVISLLVYAIASIF